MKEYSFEWEIYLTYIIWYGIKMNVRFRNVYLGVSSSYMRQRWKVISIWSEIQWSSDWTIHEWVAHSYFFCANIFDQNHEKWRFSNLQNRQNTGIVCCRWFEFQQWKFELKVRVSQRTCLRCTCRRIACDHASSSSAYLCSDNGNKGEAFGSHEKVLRDIFSLKSTWIVYQDEKWPCKHVLVVFSSKTRHLSDSSAPIFTSEHLSLANLSTLFEHQIQNLITYQQNLELFLQ